jgi:predicted amidohydrolase YtcJ
VTSIEGLTTQLQKCAASQNSEWIDGFGYDDTLIADQRHPTRQDLDVVSEERPIYLTHTSGHFATASSLALDLAGITRETPDPAGGKIVRDGNGEATGVLEETAMGLVTAVKPLPSLEDAIRTLLKGTQDYLEMGVTTVQSALTPSELIDLFRSMKRLFNFPPQRMVVLPSQEAGVDIINGEVDGEDMGKVFQIGPIKMMADGSIQGYTGYLREPYYTAYEGNANFAGYPRFETQQELDDLVSLFHSNGFQLAIHGNGDKSIDMILDAVEAAQLAFPRNDTRTVIIHAQMAQEDQLERMEKLGATPSFFNLHTYYWGDRHREIFLGPARASRISPAASALEKNLVFSFHTDTPIVPMEPMRMVWAGVNRQTVAGDTLGPDQVISMVESLKAVTSSAAYQVYEEAHRGSIEVGFAADFAVLSSNPLDEGADVLGIRVDMTVVGGEVVFVRESGAGAPLSTPVLLSDFMEKLGPGEKMALRKFVRGLSQVERV